MQLGLPPPRQLQSCSILVILTLWSLKMLQHLYMSHEFQAWCKVRSISHLTGEPHHPATYGPVEHLVQTFKSHRGSQSYYQRKLSCSTRPYSYLDSSPVNCQISDNFSLSNSYISCSHCSSWAMKSQGSHTKTNLECFAILLLYCGPCTDKNPKWVPLFCRQGSCYKECLCMSESSQGDPTWQGPIEHAAETEIWGLKRIWTQGR